MAALRPYTLAEAIATYVDSARVDALSVSTMSSATTVRIAKKNYQIDRSGPVPAVLVQHGPMYGWARMTRAELLAHKLASKFWQWLTSEGIRRPSPRGSSGAAMTYAARAATGRVAMNVYLAPDTARELAEIQKVDGTKTAAVSTAIRERAERLRK